MPDFPNSIQDRQERLDALAEREQANRAKDRFVDLDNDELHILHDEFTSEEL